jgi:hypothetical protein
MQNQTAQTSPPSSDPGFKLPGQTEKTTPNDALPKTAPDTAGQPVEIAPGATGTGTAPQRDTSGRDLAIGGAVFLVLLVVYFFVRNAYVHHLVVRRVAPSSAGSAGWLMYVGLSFLSLAAVLAIINAARYLTLGITGPLVVVGLITLVAALMVGRR